MLTETLAFRLRGNQERLLMTAPSRVPASFDGPHRYNATRFVLRSGIHTMDMTCDQWRNAFGRRATIAASVRDFVDQRRGALTQGTTWADLRAVPACMVAVELHRSRRTGHGLDEPRYDTLSFGGWGGASCWHNPDGLLVASGDAPRLLYTQAFRNGAFEAVRIAKVLAQD